MIDQIPPHSLEAEAIVLGSCLADREAAKAVFPLVSAGDFYAHIHGTIFQAITTLADAGKPHDKIAVAEHLKAIGKLEEIGNIPYLSMLMSEALGSISGADYYAKLVREKAVLYRLFTAAHKIAKVAMDGESDVSGALAEAEKLITDAAKGYGSETRGGHIDGLLAQVFREIDAAAAGDIKAQTSPWRGLDLLTGGWYPGELVAWFGRPKDGKSSAISQVLMHNARRGDATALFALEMGENSVVRRLIGNHANISSRTLRGGALQPSQWDKIGNAMTSLQGLPIYIYSSARSVSEIRRTLLGLKAKVPIKSFIVDHIGFVSDVLEGDKGASEHDKLNRAYLRLLNVAKELECVGHVVTHANRSAYDREPTMASIRGGGNLEGHAHTIIAPYRENPIENPTDGKFLVILNREGDPGALLMHFDGPRNTWTEVGA